MTKEQFKKLLYEKTSCRVQHDGWSCGTCFFSLSEKLNNKDWQTVLFFRGDYSKKELDNLPKNIPARINRIIKIIS